MSFSNGAWRSIDYPEAHMRQLFGPEGAHIQLVQEQTGCFIYIPDPVPGQTMRRVALRDEDPHVRKLAYDRIKSHRDRYCGTAGQTGAQTGQTGHTGPTPAAAATSMAGPSTHNQSSASSLPVSAIPGLGAPSAAVPPRPVYSEADVNALLAFSIWMNASIARETTPSDEQLLRTVSEIRAQSPGLGRARVRAILQAQYRLIVSEQRLKRLVPAGQ